jgi:flagellar hook-associated protein 2
MSSVSSTGSTASATLASLLSASTLQNVGSKTTASTGLSVSGLASGTNWTTTVEELANAERAPETQWEAQQTKLNTQNQAYTTIEGDLTTLQTDIETLQDPSLYQGTTAVSSDTNVATATSAAGATLGSFTFNITKLATASQFNGATGIAQTLVPTGKTTADVSLSTAAFATPVTPGTFTIDGNQITVGASDTLADVLANIKTDTNSAVTATYDSSTDKISLTSSNPIVLGSETDTSNFLQSAGLYASSSTQDATTGDYTIASNTTLGTVQLNATMADAGLKTAITGGSNGAFSINGVTINYDANNESISDVLNSINTSGAGVTASYDNLANKFVLTNNTTGAIGISMQDAAGSNFLAATGLTGPAGGTLQQGDNLLYTVNNNPTQLVSQSNTITSASSGINGLTVTPLEPGSTTVSVSTNTGAITSAINQFITDYNTAQSYISSQQAVNTSSSGTTTPSTLTGDLTASNLASDLRTSANNPVAGLSGAIKMLSDLGIQTNGQNNTIALSSASTLSTALTNNLSEVQSFFSGANSWGAQMNNWLNSTIGTGGTIPNQQATLTQESTNITTQISNLETKVSSDTAQWLSEFQAMELATSQTNQEMTYLSEQITNGTL